MKKNLVALLLVLAVVSVGVFAENPNVDTAAKTFEVETVVKGINMMKVSSAKYEADPATPASFHLLDSAPKYSVTAGGSQNLGNPIAWISTISNSRAGYQVKMTATAMKSSIEAVDAYINYTVTVDGDAVNKQIITDDTDIHDLSSAVTVIDTKTGGLAGLNAVSLGITMNVNADDFAKAVEGTYTGEIKFHWVVD